MKKIYYFCSMVVVLAFAYSLAYANDSVESRTNHSTYITIRDIRIPSLPPVGRSLVSVTDAYADYESGFIEIQFNINVGVVDISVLDQMGRKVSFYKCNTETEPFVYLSIPNDDETYILHIVGKEYEGEGMF